MGSGAGRKTKSRKASTVAAVWLMALGVPAVGAATAAPQEARDLARVNGESITLGELLHQLGALHGDLREPQSLVEMPDPMGLLQRLVDVRLVVQEATTIGLDELEGIEKQIAAGRKEIIRQTVLAERVKDIDRGDPTEVERLYRDAVREVEVESALFPSLEAAEEFRWALADGADFDSAAAAMVEAGSAKSHDKRHYVEASRLRPQLSKAVLDLEIGQTSQPLEIAEGVAMVRLHDVRYADNDEARASAEEQALAARQQAELTKYGAELRSRYARVNQKLLDSLDYDTPTPGIEALGFDDRVLVEISGSEDITVADLTARIQMKFFHGMDRAIERQRVTREVPGELDRLVLERAVALEVERLGLDQRPSFRYALQAQEDGVIFSAFVGKVINPKVELETAELEAFYEEHRSEYTTPQMMRLDSLAFEAREDAEEALRRLRGGSDLKWLSTHAEGRADPESVAVGWRFEGQILALDGLEAELRDALAGASEGDFRLAVEPDGVTHVLRVVEVFSPQAKPFEQVKKEIAGKVFARKRQEILERWLGELRKASEIEVLVDKESLGTLLGVGAEATS